MKSVRFVPPAVFALLIGQTATADVVRHANIPASLWGTWALNLDDCNNADNVIVLSHILASIPPERLADTVFSPHPAMRILRSRFPALTMFSAHRSGDPAGRIEAAEPEDTLVTRPELEVAARRLPPGGAIFLEYLASGHPFGAAVAAAMAESPSFDLSANIAGLLEAGAFTAAVWEKGNDRL
jgi:hypothetical protein